MKMKEFLKLDKPEKYDFSDEKAENDYKEISDGIEKFLAYMTAVKKDSFKGDKEQYDFFKDASKKVKDRVIEYGKVIDPDSNSQLLQEIYALLWDVEKHSNIKTGKNKVQGETLNSANTTFNKLYEFIERELDKGKEKKETEQYKRESMVTEKGKPQCVSIKFILSKYLVEEKSEIIQKMLENKELEAFVRSYHTIGNFMPVPNGCNSPRGNGSTQDYWDLTLLHIYNYYQNENEDDIVKIIGASHKEDYKEWLISFGGWHNFIEKNYLEAFVETKDEDYFPKELWKGHFSQTTSVFPEDDLQCIEYFKNAENRISERGKLMIKELKKKVEQLDLDYSSFQ